MRLYTYKQITKTSYGEASLAPDGKRIILVTLIDTVVTEVGKRKTEDGGVRERHSEGEGTRKFTQPK